MTKLGCIMLTVIGLVVPVTAGAVLFDFDNAPLGASLPIDLTVGGITAHFSATGQGFSVQRADWMGFTPVGFGGYCLSPNSVYLADLLISFSQTLTDFSIMYSPQELGCDDSARMRVTAYMNSTYVGTNTTTADPPGTWPTGTLTFSSTQGFNNVVVHYDAPPPTCQDYGVIFMADNMNVIARPNTSTDEGGLAGGRTLANSPNPFTGETSVRFRLDRPATVTVTVHDVQGRLVRTLESERVRDAGIQVIPWDGRNDQGRAVQTGIYLCRARIDGQTAITRMVLLRVR